MLVYKLYSNIKMAKQKILIVDDDSYIRKIINTHLKKEGYDVHEARDGIECMEKLADINPDGILLDIMMPRMCGEATLEALVTKEFNGLPIEFDGAIIMVSAMDDLDTAVECMSKGADYYIAKPFKPLVLRKIVNLILQNKKLEKENLELERIALLGKAAGAVIHEYNNGLAAVTGYAELIGLNINPSKFEEYIKHIQNSVKYLKSLKDTILGIYKGETLKKEQTNLAELMDMYLSWVRPDYDNYRIKIERQYEPDLREVNVSKVGLGTAILNFLINAKEAMPKGGNLTVKLSKEDDYAVLVVEDTGEGKLKKNGSRIYSADNSKKKGGHGIGLGLAKKIIKDHNGTITAEPREKKGARFTVRLPYS